MRACLRALLVAALGLATVHRAFGAAWCSPRSTEPFRPNLTQLHYCPAASPLLLLSYIWQPVQVAVKCPNSWYSVYAAQDEASLRSKVAGKEVVWCGWESILNGTVCVIRVSPFTQTLVGIKGSQACTLESGVSSSHLMPISLVIGLILFYTASNLSDSSAFRISCGSAFFTAGSLVILLVVLFRMVPHRRSLAAGMAAAGSSSLALLRWLTGHWFPSWQHLLRNRFFVAYLVVSAVVGCVVTYLYDDRRNTKVNTLIKVLLRVAGVGAIYLGTWTYFPASALLISVLLTSVTGGKIYRGMTSASQGVQLAVTATNRALRTPFTVGRVRFNSATTTYITPKGPGSTQRSAGLAAAFGAVADDAEHDVCDSLDVVEVNHLTPLHLKTPPPDPWSVQPRRRVATFEEKMVKSLLKSGTKAARTGGMSGVQGTQSSQRSGAGRVGGGDTEDWAEHGLSSRSQALAGAGSSEGVAKISPLVRTGYILNPLSGRNIKIGADVFNRLLEAGWAPDTAQGVMVPPRMDATASPSVSTDLRRSNRKQ